MTRLVEQGYVDVLFAGHALAAHDIEAALFGTSLDLVGLARGAACRTGTSTTSGPSTRSAPVTRSPPSWSSGCCAAASCMPWSPGRQFALVDSVRDDGPLPDFVTDVIAGQRAIRAALPGLGFVIMVAIMLHSIASGNQLPARIPLVCVDITSATVTKLADRGRQATGIVTDVRLFMEQLATTLSAATP
jgi:hypothetical protein